MNTGMNGLFFSYLITTIKLFLAKDGILISRGYYWSKARLMPRHLLTCTHRDRDLILRKSDPGIRPLGAVIHDVILLSLSGVRDPEHNPVVSRSVAPFGPVSDADEVGKKRSGGTWDHIDTIGGVPTSFPGLGAVPAYFGTIIAVRWASCHGAKMG